MKKHHIEISKGRFKIQGLIQEIGEDILVALWGGVRPHIGAIGIAIPRPSLKDPKKWSATSSNFTITGHKEDTLVKTISEKLASALRKVVVVTAGIHWDGMTSKDITVVETLAKRIPDQILSKISPGKEGATNRRKRR